MQQKRRVKARYRTVPLGEVEVVVNRAAMDTETKSVITTKVKEKKTMFMVYFPQGHSIRVDQAELVRHGFHLTPRLVDMDTGDLVDLGGDVYDFVTGVEDKSEDGILYDYHLQDDADGDLELEPAPSEKRAKAS